MSGSSSRSIFSASINAGMPCSRTIDAASSRVSGSTQSTGPWVVSISTSAAHPIGVGEQQLLGDHATHRVAEEHERLHPSESASATRSATMISSE